MTASIRDREQVAWAWMMAATATVGSGATAAMAETDAAATTFAASYRAWRREYYDRFPTFWGTVPGERIEEYAVFGALQLPRQQVKTLRLATTRLYHLLVRLAEALQQADDQALHALGIPIPAIPYVRISIPQMPAVMCGRFEFAMTAAGPILLEFNAETPTFVVELFHMNGQVCNDFGLIDPNAGCVEQLRNALRAAIGAGIAWVAPLQDKPAHVVFSAYANRKEECGTTEFYRDMLGNSDDASYQTAFHTLQELRVTAECLRMAEGQRIDVLYKLYPTEHLVRDEAPDGTPVGLLLLDLVRKRRLAVINPPIAFVLQNKALLAVAWALHSANSPLFTPQEHQWIERYILPATLDPYDDQGQCMFTDRYIVKPVYGREGRSITIRQGADVLEQSKETLYDSQMMVYQQFVDLPTTTIQTEVGPTTVNLVHNCFIVGGVASAVGVRASRQRIFDDSAYFLPVCYGAEKRQRQSA